MKTFTKANKCCATCSMWGGLRQIKNGQVITQDPSTRGKCYAGVNGDAAPGPCAYSNTYCKKYNPIL